MKRAVHEAIIGAGLAGLSIIAAALWLSSLDHDERRHRVQTLTNSWTSAGETVTVTTVQLVGETADQHETRHDARVDARKLKYPPDPAPGAK